MDDTAEPTRGLYAVAHESRGAAVARTDWDRTDTWEGLLFLFGGWVPLVAPELLPGPQPPDGDALLDGFLRLIGPDGQYRSVDFQIWAVFSILVGLSRLLRSSLSDVIDPTRGALDAALERRRPDRRWGQLGNFLLCWQAVVSGFALLYWTLSRDDPTMFCSSASSCEAMAKLDAVRVSVATSLLRDGPFPPVGASAQWMTYVQIALTMLVVLVWSQHTQRTVTRCPGPGSLTRCPRQRRVLSRGVPLHRHR